MKTQILGWWDSREPRERLLLSVLGGLVAIFIVVFLLILPVQSAKTTAQADLDRAKRDLTLVSRIIPASSSGQVRAPFDRAVLINTSRARGVKLTRIQPDGDSAFSVWIDDAQTESLYGFFDDLLSDYAVTMERAVVSSDANGRLSAQFTISP